MINGKPTIYKAYFLGLCKGISQQNMAKDMVLTYLQFRILEFPLIWFLMAFYHPFGGAGFRWPIHSIICWWFTRLFDVIPILFVILVAQTFHALLAFSLASWIFSGWCFWNASSTLELCHPSEHCSKLCVSPLYWLVQYRVPSSWIMIIPNTYLSNSRVLAPTARYYPNIAWWRPNFWVNPS